MKKINCILAVLFIGMLSTAMTGCGGDSATGTTNTDCVLGTSKIGDCKL